MRRETGACMASSPLSPISLNGAIVIDTNVLIAICARETGRLTKADTALNDYARRGWKFHAPGVLISEVLYVLCGKVQNGLLTATEYEEAIESFQDQMQAIFPPPHGDASLIQRAKEIRDSYGCSRATDSIFIALAEKLTQEGPTRLLTFDQALENQVKQNAPTVIVHLLI